MENPPSNYPLFQQVLQYQVGETQGTFWMNCPSNVTNGDASPEDLFSNLSMEWEQRLIAVNCRIQVELSNLNG